MRTFTRLAALGLALAAATALPAQTREAAAPDRTHRGANHEAPKLYRADDPALRVPQTRAAATVPCVEGWTRTYAENDAPATTTNTVVTYDANLMPTLLQCSDGTKTTFAYTGVQDGTWEERVLTSYDAAGGITSQNTVTRTYDDQRRLTAETTVTPGASKYVYEYSYDHNLEGTCTRQANYSWDSEAQDFVLTYETTYVWVDVMGRYVGLSEGTVSRERYIESGIIGLTPYYVIAGDFWDADAGQWTLHHDSWYFYPEILPDNPYNYYCVDILRNADGTIKKCYDDGRLIWEEVDGQKVSTYSVAVAAADGVSVEWKPTAKMVSNLDFAHYSAWTGRFGDTFAHDGASRTRTAYTSADGGATWTQSAKQEQTFVLHANGHYIYEEKLTGKYAENAQDVNNYYAYSSDNEQLGSVEGWVATSDRYQIFNGAATDGYRYHSDYSKTAGLKLALRIKKEYDTAIWGETRTDGGWTTAAGTYLMGDPARYNYTYTFDAQGRETSYVSAWSAEGSSNYQLYSKILTTYHADGGFEANCYDATRHYWTHTLTIADGVETSASIGFDSNGNTSSGSKTVYNTRSGLYVLQYWDPATGDWGAERKSFKSIVTENADGTTTTINGTIADGQAVFSQKLVSGVADGIDYCETYTWQAGTQTWKPSSRRESPARTEAVEVEYIQPALPHKDLTILRADDRGRTEGYTCQARTINGGQRWLVWDEAAGAWTQDTEQNNTWNVADDDGTTFTSSQWSLGWGERKEDQTIVRDSQGRLTSLERVYMNSYNTPPTDTLAETYAYDADGRLSRYTLRAGLSGGDDPSTSRSTSETYDYRYGTLTGIAAARTDNADTDADAPAYNLAGQRVGAQWRGLVISRGKKTVRR